MGVVCRTLRKWSSIVRIAAGSGGEVEGSFWSSLTQQGGTPKNASKTLLSRLSCCHGDRVAQEEMAIYTHQVQKERHPSNGRHWTHILQQSEFGPLHGPTFSSVIHYLKKRYFCYHLAVIYILTFCETMLRLFPGLTHRYINSQATSDPWNITVLTLYAVSCCICCPFDLFLLACPTVTIRMHAWWFVVPTLSHCNYFGLLLFWHQYSSCSFIIHKVADCL